MVLPPYLEATLMFERLFIYPNVLRRHRKAPSRPGEGPFSKGWRVEAWRRGRFAVARRAACVSR